MFRTAHDLLPAAPRHSLSDGLTALETGLLWPQWEGAEECVAALLAAGSSPFVFQRDGAWTTFAWDPSLRTRRELRNRARPSQENSPWERQPSELEHPSRDIRYGYWRVDSPTEVAITALLQHERAWRRRRAAVVCCASGWDPVVLAAEAAASAVAAAAAAARAAARRRKP